MLSERLPGQHVDNIMTTSRLLVGCCPNAIRGGHAGDTQYGGLMLSGRKHAGDLNDFAAMSARMMAGQPPDTINNTFQGNTENIFQCCRGQHLDDIKAKD